MARKIMVTAASKRANNHNGCARTGGSDLKDRCRIVDALLVLSHLLLSLSKALAGVGFFLLKVVGSYLVSLVAKPEMNGSLRTTEEKRPRIVMKHDERKTNRTSLLSDGEEDTVSTNAGDSDEEDASVSWGAASVRSRAGSTASENTDGGSTCAEEDSSDGEVEELILQYSTSTLLRLRPNIPVDAAELGEAKNHLKLWHTSQLMQNGFAVEEAHEAQKRSAGRPKVPHLDRLNPEGSGMATLVFAPPPGLEEPIGPEIPFAWVQALRVPDSEEVPLEKDCHLKRPWRSSNHETVTLSKLCIKMAPWRQKAANDASSMGGAKLRPWRQKTSAHK